MADNLRDAYRSISGQYRQKKADPWRDFEDFADLTGFEANGCFLDVGAGNGRNMRGKDGTLNVAFDLSIALLSDYVGNKDDQKVAGALPFLPFRDDSGDSLTCLAVLHHFRESSSVVESLKDIKRIGSSAPLLLSVWRRWRTGHREKIFERIRNGEDISDLVDHERPWFNSRREKVAVRFYHYYTFRELHQQVLASGYDIKKMEYMGGRHRDGNIFVLLSPTGGDKQTILDTH